MASPLAAMRIDKWLWAARFFKTRSLASAAADAGKILLNGVAVKPAREVRLSDMLEIRNGEAHWIVTVRGLSQQRGRAAQASLLYEETEASRREREAALQRRKLMPEPAAQLKGRPTKRERRRLQRLVG